MRLIDANALKEDFDCVGFNDYDDYKRVLRIIDNAPTVEPEKILVANVTFDKDELARLIDERVIEPIKNGELVLQTDERPQGEWEFDREHTEFGNPYGTYKCSCCGGHSSDKYPYCFWCGAEMRKEEET